MTTQFSFFFFTVLILTGTIFFRPTNATITSTSTDQLSCTLCDECDNPCQPPPSPPPPSPSSCPPPPASGGTSPPSVPNFPYYPPPPPSTAGDGGFGYPAPPPPNPILPYFPFYYYNPPPSDQSSFSGRLNLNLIRTVISVLFIFFFV